MRLDELEVVPYSLPFREPYVTAKGELRERRLILLRLRAEGVEGLGETAALSMRGGRGIESVVAEIRERCWPALLDGGVEPERIWAAVARCRNRGANAESLAAVDIALHDLVGRATGKPVWELLGASRAEPVVCNRNPPTTSIGLSSSAKLVMPVRPRPSATRPSRSPILYDAPSENVSCWPIVLE